MDGVNVCMMISSCPYDRSSHFLAVVFLLKLLSPLQFEDELPAEALDKSMVKSAFEKLQVWISSPIVSGRVLLISSYTVVWHAWGDMRVPW